MKKLYKILIWISWFILFSWLVYATIANTNKSSYLPWQWVPLWYYNSAHNVWTSNIAESRFTFTSWTTAWWTSVVLDSITWLSWQSNWTTQWSKTWSEANTYCNALVLWWQTDWKLPNIKQIQSIVDYSRSTPKINIDYFTSAGDIYWSSTIVSSVTANAWCMHFGDGYTYNTNSKTLYYYVRCVR